MRGLFAAVAMICFLSAAGVHAEGTVAPKSKGKPNMGSSYAPMLGEFVALTASNLLGAMKPIDAPMQVSFDREEKVLEVVIFGARSSVDGAKESLEEFRLKGVPLIQFIAMEAYEVEIAENEINLVYLNRVANYAVVLTREKGQYIVGGSE